MSGYHFIFAVFLTAFCACKRREASLVRSDAGAQIGYVSYSSSERIYTFRTADEDFLFSEKKTPSDLIASFAAANASKEKFQLPSDAKPIARRSPAFGIRADCSEFPFSFQSAVDLAKSSSSLDEFLKRLPPATMQTFTLVHHSLSPAKSEINSQWPRVIRMNKDASLYLAYSCQPDQAHSNAIEMLAYDEATGSYQMAEFDFKKGAQGIDLSGRKCGGCHSSHVTQFDPRPIWNEYPLWPGVFGSEDDSYLKASSKQDTKAEQKSWLEFKGSSQAKNNLCYSTLPWAKITQNDFVENDIAKKIEMGKPEIVEFYPYTRAFKPNQFYEGRPNLKLTEIGSRTMARRIVAKLRKHPSWSEMKYLYYLDALRTSSNKGCQIDRTVDDKIKELFPAYDSSVADRDLEKLSTLAHMEAAIDPRSGVASISRIYQATKLVGMSDADWHMKFDRTASPAYRGAIRVFDTNSFDGDLAIPQMVAGLLTKTMSADFSEISKNITSPRTSSYHFGERFSCIDDVASEAYFTEQQAVFSFGGGISAVSMEGACDKLKTAFLNQKISNRYDTVASDEYDVAPVTYSAILATDSVKVSAGKNIAEGNCRSCHNSSSVEYPSKTLHFMDSETLFIAALKDDPSLFSRVLRRLNDEINPMPPSGLLPADQRAALQAYFHSAYGRSRGLLP